MHFWGGKFNNLHHSAPMRYKMVQVQPRQAKYKYTRDLCIRHAVARTTNKPSCGGGLGMFIIFPYALQVHRKFGAWYG